MQENTNNIYEDEGIDVAALFARLWKRRSLIIKCCVAGVVLGLIAGFSIPKTYKAKAVFTPETQQRIGAGVSSIASMMGVSLDNSMDAIDVEMYPDVVGSTPFLFNLLDLQVQTKDGRHNAHGIYPQSSEEGLVEPYNGSSIQAYWSDYS